MALQPHRLLPQGWRQRAEVAFLLLPVVAVAGFLGGWTLGGAVPVLSWYPAVIGFAVLTWRALTVAVWVDESNEVVVRNVLRTSRLRPPLAVERTSCWWAPGSTTTIIVLSERTTGGQGRSATASLRLGQSGASAARTALSELS